MVDGKSLVGMAHEEAVAVLRATHKLVQLVVATDCNEGESIASSLQSIPDHMRNGNRSLALQAQQLPALDRRSLEAQIEPEVLGTPVLNSYHQDVSMEMAFLRQEKMGTAMTGHMETDVDDPLPDSSGYTVEILRDKGEPLGIRLAYERGSIFIKSVDPEGVAGRSKMLLEGRQLISVNGISLENKTKSDAIEILSVSESM